MRRYIYFIYFIITRLHTKLLKNWTKFVLQMSMWGEPQALTRPRRFPNLHLNISFRCWVRFTSVR